MAKLALDKVKKAEAVPNYEEIVPVETRDFNTERVSNFLIYCSFDMVLMYAL